MCGIIGYSGAEYAREKLLHGLENLEYRGYDSAGIALWDEGKIEVIKAAGRLSNLRAACGDQCLASHCGIGHTRWATHGVPNDVNAHPHRQGRVTLVHNGIIENYRALRERLEREGYHFLTQTDTEIAAALLDHHMKLHESPVAAIHAGWRGTLARIVHKTIQEMAFAYHTEPKKLKAVIGPGISLEHFEVGDEVYEAFEQAAFPMEEIAEQRPNAAFSVDVAERERLAAEGNIVQPLKWHINLPLCNKQILLHCGVAEENIKDCGICTFAHSDEFFSATKLGIESGRIYTGILMK